MSRRVPLLDLEDPDRAGDPDDTVARVLEAFASLGIKLDSEETKALRRHLS